MKSNKRKSHRRCTIPSGILIIFVFTTVISLIAFFSFKSIINKKIMNSSVVAEKLTKLKELVTTNYTYTKVLEVKNDREFNGVTIPFTQKYFMLQYDGYIKAGVDLSKLDIKINNYTNTITLKLDHSKILDDVINQDSIHIYDEKSGLFNKLALSDMVNEITAQKSIVEEEVIKKGLLQESDTNANVLLEEILKDMGFKNISIVYNQI
jgi:hypothetical protein